ncbi:MAG: hypothetical protein PHP93_04170 [Kiritimatiellales bacterium]|nr:hypothetical protein [Kiritimatiellales bacterium]
MTYRSGGRYVGWAVFSVLFFWAQAGFCEDDNPVPSSHPTSAWIVSPLFGLVKNESLKTGNSDVSPEYGLFAMYASPRFIVNNTTFFTDVNSSEVWGNISSISLYGDSKANLTWYLGGSYVWHQVTVDPVKIRIDEPLGKVGLVWRIPSKHLTINPYVGYAQERVHTEVSVSTPGGTITFKSVDHSDIVVYGISAYWHWRMLGADAKYYLSQNLDSETLNQHFRVWGTAMFNQKVGVIGRFEYEEQNTTRDTSFLFGPVFVF